MNISKIHLYWLKFRLRYFERFCSPYLFNKILKMEGFEIGEHTIFYGPNNQNIDRQRPWMLKIGDYCKITNGCTILTHDYSRSVIRRYDGQIIGEAGTTEIGNNVFVGVNSIILMGTHIGDNVIVGAGSVVSGHIPSNVVVAGNPAKIIRSLDDHIIRRKTRTIDEAFLYFNKFVDWSGREPSLREMGPFFPLFIKREKKVIENAGVNITPNGDNPEELFEALLNSEPEFKNYEEFKKCALKKRERSSE